MKNSASYSDFLEFGINYTGEFSGFTRRRQRHRHQRQRPRATVTAPALKDFTAWQVGARVGYGGFKLGGGYVDAGNFNVPVSTDSGNQHSWNVGATYTAGPIAVGVSYLDAEGYKAAAAFGTGTYADSYQAYGLSGAYTVAPGLILQSDLMFLNEELKRNPTPRPHQGRQRRLRVADQHPPELLKSRPLLKGACSGGTVAAAGGPIRSPGRRPCASVALDRYSAGGRSVQHGSLPSSTLRSQDTSGKDPGSGRDTLKTVCRLSSSWFCLGG